MCAAGVGRPVKIVLELSEETLAALNEFEEADQIAPDRRVHQYLRRLVYDPGPSGVSWAAEVSALLQRGRVRTRGREFTAASLRDRAVQFGAPEKPGVGIEITIGQRLSEYLPLVVAYMDLQASAQDRDDRLWNDLPTFARIHVSAEVAKEFARMAAKDAEDEERALYRPTPKADKAP